MRGWRGASVLVVSLLAAEAQAARLAVPLPELCAASALVVVAEVTGREVHWGEQQLLETWSDLAIHQVLRGQAPTEPLRVVTLGGSLGGLRLEISEAPTLAVDARYLLLLSPRADGGWTLHGGPDGAIPLGDEVAARARLGSCLAP